MGAPDNLHVVNSPRVTLSPISIMGTPRAFPLGTPGAVMTPKTPATPTTPQFSFVNKPALMEAVENENEEAVSELINLGVNVNDTYVRKSTPLMVATRIGNEEIVGKLLEAGANVNQKDTLGRTSLMWACISFPQNEFIVWRLLNAGASTKGVHFGYGMSARVSKLLQEFGSGLLLPRDSKKTFALMQNAAGSRIPPELLKLTISFLTLDLRSLKKTLY